MSIHSGGKAQWSMDAVWYGQNRPNQPNRHRHILKWDWSPPSESFASHVFRISVPNSELRKIDLIEDLSGVTWLPAPGEGEKATVECYISPAPASKAPTTRSDFVTALDLTAQCSVVALLTVEPISEKDRQNIALVKVAAREQLGAAGQTIEPGYRGVGVFRDDHGVRGMFEFIPAAV